MREPPERLSPYLLGKHCIGSMICTPAFRMWFQSHQGVFLVYPLGPLIGFEPYDGVFLYFVYTYDEERKH